MPERKTKRGAERTPLNADVDVFICGGSFAGLSVARELRGLGKDVLVIDRYDIGEKQTSACAAPTEWLDALGLQQSIKQTFSDLVIHTRASTYRMSLPWTFSTFDYRRLCELLWDQRDDATRFDTATVTGRTANTVHTDRGDITAPLIVDALGWRRELSNSPDRIQPPDAYLSRGLEVHPHASGDGKLPRAVDRPPVRPRRVRLELPGARTTRIGVGSFDPRFHVKEPTVRLASDEGQPAERYQGNWIPHKLRPATEDGIFFAGDSAGHCLPLTAEGIRTAFYFGLAAGREIRAVLEGRQHVSTALQRYHAFSHERDWTSRRCCAPSGWSRACTRGCSTSSSPASAHAWSTGRSSTTSRSRRRRSPGRAERSPARCRCRRSRRPRPRRRGLFAPGWMMGTGESGSRARDVPGPPGRTGLRAHSERRPPDRS